MAQLLLPPGVMPGHGTRGPALLLCSVPGTATRERPGAAHEQSTAKPPCVFALAATAAPACSAPAIAPPSIPAAIWKCADAGTSPAIREPLTWGLPRGPPQAG